MFFRRGVRNDRWLGAKMALFTAGALLAVAGMSLRRDWLIGLAAIVLAAGILLRVIAPRSSDDADPVDRPGRSSGEEEEGHSSPFG